MNWTKFKNATPKSLEIYITDYTSVWIGSRYDDQKTYWLTFAVNNPEYAWAEIPLPEIPEEPKEWHKCKGNDLYCYEEDVALFLRRYNTLGILKDVAISFCPFCGYSPKSANKE